jgi:hypothetical protein
MEFDTGEVVMAFIDEKVRHRPKRFSVMCRLLSVGALAAVLSCSVAVCEAGPVESGAAPRTDALYHTPLAGEACEACEAIILGREIRIPVRNRENILSRSLGVNGYVPAVGGDDVLPIAALYWRHRWDDWWVRSVIGVFVNEVDTARSFGRFQLLGHFENDTVPFVDTEIKNGKEVKSSAVT